MNAHSSVTIGTPITMRGRVGFVAEKRAEFGHASIIGAGGLTAVRENFVIVWDDGSLSELPDAIAAPHIEQAKAIELEPVADVAAKLAEARAKQTAARALASDKEAERKRTRAEFEADAAQRVPAWAKAVIVAEYERDDCDSMSDYYNTVTERVVILGFSRHARDLFPELRSFARGFPATASLADAPANAEHREKYSMGAGYYLKASGRYSSGWTIRKRKFWSGEPAKQIPTGEWYLSPAAAPTLEAAPANAAATSFRIEQHTHTKKGFEMFLCVPAARVERGEFDRLRDMASALGGWYSRQWGNTPGGFAFRDREAAEKFAALNSETPPTDAPPTAPEGGGSHNVAERLRALAAGMQAEIDAKFADRLANTPKRQRQAGESRNDGTRLRRTQSALRALASHHDAGTLPAELSRITTKKAAFELVGTIIKRDGGYYDAGVDTGKPALDTPQARALWAIMEGPNDADRDAEALRRKIEGLRFSNIPGYFPTPPAVVSRMIDAACVAEGEAVAILEPSAGSGAILDALRQRYPQASLHAYERQETLRQILVAKGYTLCGSDFLESEPHRCFRYVLMNPPFERGQDMEHVRHAFEMLEDGGRLVAIMSPGAFFRSDNKACAFREWLYERGGDCIELPAGAFKESGTDVASVLVVLSK